MGGRIATSYRREWLEYTFSTAYGIHCSDMIILNEFSRNVSDLNQELYSSTEYAVLLRSTPYSMLSVFYSVFHCDFIRGYSVWGASRSQIPSFRSPNPQSPNGSVICNSSRTHRSRTNVTSRAQTGSQPQKKGETSEALFATCDESLLSSWSRTRSRTRMASPGNPANPSASELQLPTSFPIPNHLCRNDVSGHPRSRA